MTSPLTLTGTAGADNLVGGALNDKLTGLAGDDTLNGGAGADVMAGGLGNDTYYVDNALDKITESAGQGIDSVFSSVSYTLAANVENLTLTGYQNINATGNTSVNVLDGNCGDNTLDGKTGADTMTGHDGNDVYIVDNVGDVVNEYCGTYGGIDTIRSSINFDLSLHGANVENLVLTGTAAKIGIGNCEDNVITGNTGVNTLSGLDGNDTLDGGAGADTMIGGTGCDVYHVDNVGDRVIENAGEGHDTVISSISFNLATNGANVEDLTLTGAALVGTGNALDNHIIGDALNNTLIGGDGNDILDGGAGADTMTGGAGNDTYYVDNAHDVINEIPDDGVDTVISSIDYTLLHTSLENLTLTGSAVNGTGNGLDNIITGNMHSNVLDGGAGNDTIDGGGCGDVDTMIGGTGNDTFIVDNFCDNVVEQAGQGTDLVLASVSYHLADNVENLTLTGYQNINATGNCLDNVITGNCGDNSIDGGAGNDTMMGGLGNDTYVVDSSGDVVVENSCEGHDTVISSIDYALTANVEDLQLTGCAVVGTGNELCNTITGNEQDNTLFGGDGHDVLYGNAGNDSLDGGAGADDMYGGCGNDTYFVDNVCDNVFEDANNGTDTVISSIACYTLTDNVENLQLAAGAGDINGYGNALDNVITGNEGVNIIGGGDGNDTLDGGAGADTMLGGLGNDTYYVDNAGDVVTENPNEGHDIVFSSVDYQLSDNVEDLTLQCGTGAITAIGNTLDNVLTGNENCNTLIGLDGNDTLDGGSGPDVMMGGTGNDVYYVDNFGDQVIENPGEGTDTVISSLSCYTLTDNVENLVLASAAGCATGYGNGLDNVITGNEFANNLYGYDGNDTIDGGAGADYMAGGCGNDTYYVDNAGDTVYECWGQGHDLVISSVDYTLPSNVEDLTLVGTALYGEGNWECNVITGNAFNNTLVGDAGDDTLNGGTGADTMDGGSGNDTFYVDNLGDVVTDSSGIDTVIASVNNYTLATDAENLILSGVAKVGFGNASDNIITANNSLNNTLSGGDGNDTLLGGNGNDSLDGGNGNDTLDGGNGSNTLTGGAGQDTFVMHVGGSHGVDTMTDFSPFGDVLDLRQVLDVTGASGDTLGHWLQMVGNQLQVDTTGQGTNWQTIAQFSGVTGLTGASEASLYSLYSSHVILLTDGGDSSHVTS